MLLLVVAVALALIARLAIDAGGDVLTGTTTIDVRHPGAGEVAAVAGHPGADDAAAGVRQPAPSGPIGEADGFIAVGGSISPFDHVPAIDKLDPRLRAVVQQAARDAQADGIDFRIDSGWRSARYQQELLDKAVTTYGSLAEARRYVNTPQASTHVRGEAVDVGPTDADSWLQQHGADYGLCQIYNNEMWHFELATQPGGTCPPPRVDASDG